MSQQIRPPFRRVAIVNRGEPAMRLINAVREWNEEGRPPLRSIAVYTAVDRRAMYVREADEAVLVGPVDPEEGAAFGPNPYLDYAELERALRACRADAVWPGWGFVSEKAEFAELCDRLGITFVGRRRRSCAGSATRLSRSGWLGRSGCRSRRGAAARWPTWSRPAPRPR